MVGREFRIEGRTAAPMLGTGRWRGRVIQSWAGVEKKLGRWFIFFIFLLGQCEKGMRGIFSRAESREWIRKTYQLQSDTTSSHLI
jgi:hypothetical protein